MGTYMMPYTLHGTNNAAFHGLFIHYIVGLWITPAGYVLIYYFLPVAARNPVYSHKLSLVGFWSLALFYPFVGIHHYLYSPSPMGGDHCHRHLHAADHSGLDGARELLRNDARALGHLRAEPASQVPDHGLGHVLVRLLPGIDGGAAWNAATDALHRLRDFSLAPDGVRHLRGLGHRGLIFTWPRIHGRELWSFKLANWSFWLITAGISLMGLGLSAQGLQQGLRG